MASDREVDDFLASHGPFVPPPLYRDGEAFGEWRVTAFLGRGGSAEVYRAVHGRPGTLDVDLAGGADVTVEILNRGVLLNRSDRAYPDSGIRYVVDNGSYLNFVNQDWPKGKMLLHVTVGGEMAMLDYGGPTSYRDAQIKHYGSLEKAQQNGEKRD